MESLAARIGRWFALDETWERPTPGREGLRADVVWAVVVTILTVVGHEMMRAGGALQHERLGWGWQYAVIVSLTALVAVRRRFPVTVMVIAGLHIFAAAAVTPMTVSSLTMQLAYFFLIFSGVAWGKDRRAVLRGVLLVLVVLVLWMAWNFALTSGLDRIRSQLGAEADRDYGLVSPLTGVVIYGIMANLIFFAGAITLGIVVWRGALRSAQVTEQAATISAQSDRLRDQAVVAERLRIARELHDVVAHHVSVMGVQASAARRVLDRDPEAARTALGAIEQASRDGVGQMRELLGTLRSEELAGDPGASVTSTPTTSRAPQPTLATLPALVEQATTPACEVSLDLVESSPDAGSRVPPPVQLSAYRVVQEALANVRRHSTAQHARVTVRVDEPAARVEVEVVDDGVARVGTAGTGLGQRGMRERAELLGGGVDLGPRAGTQGYRVRVWFPLDGRRRSDPAPDPAADAADAPASVRV